MQYFMDTRTNG